METGNSVLDVPSETAPVSNEISTGSNKWLVVILAMALQMVTFGSFVYSFTFWIAPWTAEFEVGRASILIIPTVFLYTTAGAAFFLGKYIDKLSQRTIASIGLVFYSLSMVGISFAPNLNTIYLIYALFVPIACTLAGPIAAIAFVSHVFDKGRGFAIGIVTMGTSLGGMIIPNIVAALVEDVGWRDTHLIIGLPPLLLLPFIYFLMTHKPSEKTVENKSTGPELTTMQVLKQPDIWVCIVSFMLAYFVFLSIQFNMAPIGSDLGVDIRGTALIVGVFTFGMIPGKLLTGYFADQIDPKFLFMGICTTIFVAVSCLAMYPPLPVVAFAFLLMGLGCGGLIPLKGALMANIFGPDNVGRVLGVSAPFIAAYGIGPIYAAWVRDTTGSYDLVFYSLLVLITFAAFLILLLRTKPNSSVVS